MSVLKSRNNVSECPYPLQVFEEPVRYYSGCGYKEGWRVRQPSLIIQLKGLARHCADPYGGYDDRGARASLRYRRKRVIFD